MEGTTVPCEDEVESGTSAEGVVLPVGGVVVPARGVVFPSGIVDVLPVGFVVLPVGSDILPIGSDVLPIGSDVLPIGSDVLPVGSDVLPIGSDVLPVGSDVLPAGSDVLPGGGGEVLSSGMLTTDGRPPPVCPECILDRPSLDGVDSLTSALSLSRLLSGDHGGWEPLGENMTIPLWLLVGEGTEGRSLVSV